jgi:hypothetical protein
MKRNRAPLLAAALVVTVSAGCGGAAQESTGPEDQSNLGRQHEWFTRNQDGTCSITHSGHPPWTQTVDCATRKPFEEPAENEPAEKAP